MIVGLQIAVAVLLVVPSAAWDAVRTAASMAVVASAAPSRSGAPARRTARSIAPHTAAATPVRLTVAEQDSLRASILKDRSSTERWLASDTMSYLATIQRLDFGGKSTLTVGAAPDNDVRIAEGVQPHHLRVTVGGDSFHVEAVDPDARFTTRAGEMREATLGPSTIGLGRYRLRLSHQRFPALIVFDPQSPRFREYKGISYFPVDLSWRYVLPLTPNPRPDTVVILSTRSNRRHALRVGWFDFLAGGRACRLEVTKLLEPGVGENDYGIFFRDATTGKESYGVGRYIDPERLPDGRFVLDFNLAYNPACAYSEHYNCPIPRRENTLAIAVRAGEKNAHYLH